MMSCIAEDVDTKHRINGALYSAIMEADKEKVLELCLKVSDHALHRITVNDDTVLHMATYAKEADLVLKLLDELPEHHLDKMTRQNGVGSTILHEAATNNYAIPIAEKLLKKAPGLLGMRNNNGETALFRAARYGNTKMFKFLGSKITQYDQVSQQFYLQRNIDKTTVLHIAIISQHFELARHIANEYKQLIGEKDSDEMTALQLLACEPSAFKIDREEGFINLIKWCCSPAWRRKIQNDKQKYKLAVELVKFLVKRDTSWEASYSAADKSKPKIHRYGGGGDASSMVKEAAAERSSASTQGQKEEIGETPLILATKSGCVEIAKEILRVYPQAVEHIDDEGRNVLHVAIKYRQLKIFESVKEMEVPMARLVRKVDNNGNTILHTVALKRKDFVVEKVEGPALLLQEELLWFERVQEITPLLFMYHKNNMNLAADEFFNRVNSELRSAGKEWLKSTAEGCSVVAVLIATVAFAAAYTVPGGNQSNGLPVLLNHPLFVVFTVTDVLSLNFALTAVVTFLSILSSPFRFKDFKRSLPNKLMLGFTFLFLSVAMMMMSFGATIFLMIHSKESWTKISLYALSFIPVGIFALSYFNLYSSLSKTYKYLLGKARQAAPLSTCMVSDDKKPDSFRASSRTHISLV
ncbi:ankyrin repeat-containing protein At5g02620 [Hevea brasiliensis]|uniref:ankyrin repeat-containing protein At5g02620 n=1 Tax=Hevea brasiliensis TaxID=3981 RepID=UPI0025F27CA0|nr:ankyrin repeat-containing protein At5g02620 [Hevea brasiliensis]